ncbi:nucleotidyltransferase domain-containing protein [Halobaculum magnesiiphilum]|uniref:Nucleotidyltransferase domain-containing protein n=1 Tax=Halobaculum magnesiiphilum TaxID=1017351 RepID=A0A8T8W945_9EURY|nr:nucleotidyltransferase domain-containing protein [Halobaculum magnesiiphilum]
MSSNGNSGENTRVTVDIPLRDGRLFKSEATDDILLFLIRHHGESFSMTEIAEAVDYTRPTITKAVDVLSNNDLVVEERDGSRRLVQINRDRVTRPDDPYLEIPQSEFHAPVAAATEAILDELDDVLAVVLYGSVARGEADRRSDIDLWVLVREDRMGNQRRANQVRQSLEADTFTDNTLNVRRIGRIMNDLPDVLIVDATGFFSDEEVVTVRSDVRGTLFVQPDLEHEPEIAM